MIEEERQALRELDFAWRKSQGITHPLSRRCQGINGEEAWRNDDGTITHGRHGNLVSLTGFHPDELEEWAREAATEAEYWHPLCDPERPEQPDAE